MGPSSPGSFRVTFPSGLNRVGTRSLLSGAIQSPAGDQAGTRFEPISPRSTGASPLPGLTLASCSELPTICEKASQLLSGDHVGVPSKCVSPEMARTGVPPETNVVKIRMVEG